MNRPEAVDCLICREHDGRVPIPGGHLIADEHVIAFHLPPMPKALEPYLGYLFVTSRRHVPSFAELDSDEAAAMGVAISRLSAALKAEGADPVYLAGIGHAVPHLHIHLIPRWPETPTEISWINVDDWEGARRGGAEVVNEWTVRLRNRLESLDQL